MSLRRADAGGRADPLDTLEAACEVLDSVARRVTDALAPPADASATVDLARLGRLVDRLGEIASSLALRRQDEFTRLRRARRAGARAR